MGTSESHPPLLERDAEIALLAEAVERSRGGRGSLVLVEGPPGAGKSALLRAARRIAEEAAVAVLAARSTELECELSLGVARQLLPAQELGRRGATAAERGPALIERFHRALLQRVFPTPERPEPVPHLILVDDAQWADPLSLRFLAHLAVRLDDLPVVAVVAVRTDDAATPPEVHALRASPAARTLRPAPLSEAAVGELVRSACGPGAGDELVRACAGASRGNPFYLLELLHVLSLPGATASAETVRDAAPRSVLNAVLARLAHLGPDPAALASAVALLGDGILLAIAAEMAGLSLAAAEAAADALAAAHVLDPGDPLSIAHPLIASTLRSDMGSFARARAHRRAADLLAGAGAPVEVVAAHLLHAPPQGDAEALRQLREGAALHRSRGAPRASARLLERALAESPRPEQRTEMLIELAESMAEDADPRAIGTLEQALAEVADPRRRSRALIELSVLVHHAGNYALAAELAMRSHAELPADGALQGRSLAAFIAPGLLHPPLVGDAFRAVEGLLVSARAGTPPTEPSLLALAAAFSASSEGSDELVRGLATAAFAADPLVSAGAQGISLGFAAAALVWVDALDEAEPLLEAAVEESRRRGAVMATSIAAHFRAQVHYFRGRLDQAVADAELSLESYRNGWAESAWSTPILVLAHLERGDLDAAADAIAIGERGDPARIEHALLLESRAALALARGDHAAALADARGAIAHVEENFSFLPTRGFDCPRIAAIAAHRLGQEAEAGRLMEERLVLLRGLGTRRQLGMALMTAGVIAGGQGGLELLERAVAVLERSPSRLQLAHALVELGAARRRLGKRDAARESLYEGLQLADAFGALPLAEQARSELARLGLRPRRAAHRGPASLTPSEARVAELAARGLSTPQIAHELHITRKTVESHLSQAYKKLRIDGRSGLAAAMRGETSAEPVDSGTHRPFRR